MGEALLIALALATLVCFGAIFCLALAEYRRVDPADYGTPWGDVIDPVALRRATEAADAYLEGMAATRETRGGRELQRAAANTQVRFALHDGSATNR